MATNYRKDLIYPQSWTEPAVPAGPVLPTQATVETFMKTFLSTKPVEEQVVMEKVMIQFKIPHEAAKPLVEAVEKKWHPEKYAPPIIEEPGKLIEEP